MKNICDLLPFTANKEQSAMLKRILKFVDPGNDEDFHIISGPGGTGKTTCTKAIADYLTAKEIQFHIIAPTARAAKVIGGKTGKNAKTIHSHIYMAESLKESAGVRMSLKSNLDRKYAITIVDEASMISDDLNKSETFITEEPLLNALMKYTKEGNTKKKTIIKNKQGLVGMQNIRQRLNKSFAKQANLVSSFIPRRKWNNARLLRGTTDEDAVKIARKWE